MKSRLLEVSLQNQAIYLEAYEAQASHRDLHPTTLSLAINVSKLGYGFSEELLQGINTLSPKEKLRILNLLKEKAGVKKNWTPLVKGWDIPTGESLKDHYLTFLNNFFPNKKGSELPCGHFIPRNTFPLSRYNGCPYCGTPFEFGELTGYGKGGKQILLELWTDDDIKVHLQNLLASPAALDATQVESLKSLLAYYPVSAGSDIPMKETLMLVIQESVKLGKVDQAGALFKTPNDILRYLWYEKTGFLQIIRPQILIERSRKNALHVNRAFDDSRDSTISMRKQLKLKYSRAEGRRVAKWLNDLAISPQAACEIMHPKRGMWIRFIRALRLVEYSNRKGFEKLKVLLDKFHKEDYIVYEGRIQQSRMRQDAQKTFALLKQRPGLFARSLFSNILWFGLDASLEAFREILAEVPSRLLLSLNMYAPLYFNIEQERLVRPLGGNAKRIPTNPLLMIYDEAEREKMIKGIEKLCLEALYGRFKAKENENDSIFIDEALFKIPLSLGDRGKGIKDEPALPMGTRLPVQGNKIRLFMQWGEGLKAQHLDMDLSCKIAFKNRMEYCSYSCLTATGSKHSGDIQYIPNKVGTAEYIELDLDTLSNHEAKYVSFTCNAYTSGALAPNMIIGWMNSAYPMRISNKTGVAYDPSAVQHKLSIGRELAKGLLFGILDVQAREVIWAELPFGGQVVQNLDLKTVEALLNRLDSKISLGKVLELKAEAQGLQRVEQADQANEAYDELWAKNTAQVMNDLLI